MNDTSVKVYVITFLAADVNLATLNQYLFDSSDIIAFWNYVPLVYCVKTRLIAKDLAHKLKPFFPHGDYFIGEINHRNIDGLLPRAAWEWFYLDHHEKHRAPALPPPPTDWASGLLALGGGKPPPNPFTGLLTPPFGKK
jgi:hypothetical protein